MNAVDALRRYWLEAWVALLGLGGFLTGLSRQAFLLTGVSLLLLAVTLRLVHYRETHDS